MSVAYGNPAVTFPNPEAVYVGDLRAVAADPPAEYFPSELTTIATSFPATRLAPGTTALQIALEVGGSGYPVTERAQVRFTAHSDPDSRPNAIDLASLVQALVATRRPAGVLGVRLLGGRSKPVVDPETKNHMVWFLAEISLKATPLSS